MTYFLAEVGSNHNRDLDRVLRFVEMAAASGFDGVKFQLFRGDEITANVDAAAAYAAQELPPRYVAHIAEACRRAGVEFVITPFAVQDVRWLAHHVDRFKVSSFDILRLDLFDEIRATGLPVIVSCGMGDASEIAAAAYHCGGDVTLLHCVSAYPTPPNNARLAGIQALRCLCPRVGYSDHTANPDVVKRAVWRYAASVVEMHVDLDGAGSEYHHGHCWRIEDAGALIAQVRAAEDFDGGDDPADWDQRADTDGMRPLRSAR